MKLMKNNKKWDKSRIYNTIIASLSALLVINVMVFVLCVMDHNYDYSVDESSVLYSLEYYNYGSFTSRAKQYEAENDEISNTMKEAIVLANYFDAYLFYKSYTNTNELEKANEYLTLMEEYELDIDLLSLEFEKIKVKLGV